MTDEQWKQINDSMDRADQIQKLCDMDLNDERECPDCHELAVFKGGFCQCCCPGNTGETQIGGHGTCNCPMH
jgi:hypothetical protein